MSGVNTGCWAAISGPDNAARGLRPQQSGLVSVVEDRRAEQLPGANDFHAQQITRGVEVENDVATAGTLYDDVSTADPSATSSSMSK